MNSEDIQTILIVDDHPLFRKGVIQLIQTLPELKFVGEAANGADGIRLARELDPDLVLLDLNMKDMSGVEVLKAVKAAGLDARVIMLTVSDHADDLVAALQAGATATCSRTWSPRT